MNRRSFIGSILALGAARALPALPAETVSVAVVRWKVYCSAVILNAEWMAVIEREWARDNAYYSGEEFSHQS